jgi:hypothetical protein
MKEQQRKNMVLSPEFAEQLAELVKELLEECTYAPGEAGCNTEPGYRVDQGDGIERVETFEEAMMLNSNKGLVVEFRDGSTAQITVTALVERRPGQ